MQIPSAASEMTDPQRTTSQARYEQLSSDRAPYLKRGRDAAELTLPALLPQEGANGSTDYARPWQSIGARGANTLSAKLLLTLFPPGTSFFRLSPDSGAVAELKALDGDNTDVEGKIQAALSQVEQQVTAALEATNLRSVMAELMKHLVVVGNALLFATPDGSYKWFRLNKYVVLRDLEGTPLEIIVKETLARRTLPPKARAAFDATDAAKAANADLEEVDLYTHVQRQQDGSWKVHQEIAGSIVEGSEGSYPKGKSAWIPLTWNRSEGEHYGRSHVDDYLGDLVSLESLSQSLVDASAAMARFITMVNESGVTSRKAFAEAPNLSVIDGDARDITTYAAAGKSIDMQVTQSQAAAIQQRLEQGFLLTSSIQRNAERVTAEEIRLMANELEQTLGGVYPTLSRELQFPIVQRVLLDLTKRKKIVPLPDGVVTPQIVTGIDGLGRSSEFSRLNLLMSDAGQKFGQQVVAEYVRVGDYLQRSAAALAVPTEGFIRSEEEVQQARQQAQQAQLAAQLGPTAIQAQSDQALAAQQQSSAQSALTQ